MEKCAGVERKLSELEKVKAEVNAIFEGLSNIVAQLTEIQKTWDQSGKVGAEAIAIERLAKEAIEKTRQMRNRPGLWLPSVEAPELKNLVLRHMPDGFDVELERGRFTLKIYGENNGFISFWPRSSK